MLLEIPLYTQTTDFTCGACATLMVSRYFDENVQLSKKNEFLVWADIIALPFKFSSPYRIAAFFIKKGFETKLIMKQKTIEERKTLLNCCQTDSSEKKVFFDFFKAYNRLLRDRIASSIVNRRPTLNDIIEGLSNYNPIIILVNSYYTTKIRGEKNPDHLPHWIVVKGYENKSFYINDSFYDPDLQVGETTIERQILKKAMDTYPRFGWPSALISVGLNSKRNKKK